MRLLEIDERGELGFTKVLQDNDPTYAILSHTWGREDEEVDFNDLKTGFGMDKPGYSKIQFCEKQAYNDGIYKIWVDTCCIDKSSSAEVATAIASMYQWYCNVAKCYVFLSDVSTLKRDCDGSKRLWEPAFRKSRWFTRGWTLQELLAPTSVEFFSREGVRLGDKGTLEQMIHEITSIPIEALRGAPLHRFSVPERMRWQQQRQVTIEEDRAYCLLGIFEVFMHPIYGEGKNAFVRLNDEIRKSHKRQLDLPGQAYISSLPRSLQKPDHDSVFDDTQGTVSNDRQQLLTSLSFHQMDSRRSTIKRAYATTCQWLLQHPAYLDWIDSKKLEEHCGFLWINGKPGAGKSTLIKFVHACADEKRSNGEILISFFFNARGEELERSTVGMYRALLFQLLDRAPDLQTILDDLYPASNHQSQSPTWTIESLCELLSAAVSKLGQRRLKCFIDALDECNEQDVREMIDFFEDLGQKARDNGTELYICFASRHYPAIDIQNGRRLILEDELGHAEDLAKYIRSHLRAGKGKYIEDVRTEIHDKANGVFMWAVLVVNILNKEFRDGRIFAVKRRLQEIPLELSDLFRDILRRDSANMTQFLLCLQWILFAERPLKREEYYFAMVCGLDPGYENITEWDPDHVTTDHMQRFVLTSSKGLAELTKSKTPTVQFIHESVRDFLVKDNGLYELWPELKGNLHSLSHNRLKQCCQIYMNIDISAHVSSNEILPKASSQSAIDLRQTLNIKYPFLQYASQHVLYHADEAATGIPQDDFLRDFALNAWIRVTNALEQYEIRRHTTHASLLYVFAEKNYARLIRLANRNSFVADVRGERYRYPLIAALANGHQAAVRALLHQDAESIIGDIAAPMEYGRLFSFRKDHTPLSWALENGHQALAEFLMITSFDINKTGPRGRTPLSWAAQRGYETVVKLLVGRDNVVADSKDFDGRTPLYWAAQEGHKAVVKLLVERDDVVADSHDYLSQTPLSWAARRGHEAIVKLLVERDDVVADSKDDLSRTPLSWAAQGGHEAIVKLLVERDDVVADSESYFTQTPLSWAARRGHEAVVKLLVERDDVVADSKDNHGLTPLNWAAQEGHKAVVKLLVERDDVVADSHDYLSQTPLSWAARRGHEAIVKLLVERDDVVADSKDDLSRTPLSWAAQGGHEAIVKLLVERDDVVADSKDNHGLTPLNWAARGGHQAVMKLLRLNLS